MKVSIKAQTPCQERNPDDWYADDVWTIRKAISLCHTCPMLEACREQAPDNESGIWGGLTPQQRTQWKKTGQLPSPWWEQPDDIEQLLPSKFCRARLHNLDEPGSRTTAGACRECVNRAHRARRRRLAAERELVRSAA